MKIRHIILVLTGGLGFALILVAVVLLQEELAKLDTARRLQASNSVREELLVASTALSHERTETYIRLTRSEGAELGQSPMALRMEADDALLRAQEKLEAGRSYLRDTERSLASLRQVQAEIATLQAIVAKISSWISHRQHQNEVWNLAMAKSANCSAVGVSIWPSGSLARAAGLPNQRSRLKRKA